MKTHTSKYKDSAALSIGLHSPSSYIRLFSPTWGNPRQARGNPKLLGLILKAHRELKGMNLGYSQFFRQVRPGWDWVFHLELPRSFVVGFFSSFAANLSANPQFTSGFSFHTLYGWFNGKICQSRDSFIPVSLFRILNSKGRGFLMYSLSRTFQPTSSYDATSLAIFFLENWQTASFLRKKHCFYLYFKTIHHRLSSTCISSHRGGRLRVKLCPWPIYSDLVKYPYIYDISV